jgi:hypothetical protein
VFVEEGEGGVEEEDGARGGFVREELGEGQAGVIVDGDVEELPARSAGVIVLTIPGDAVAEAFDPGELLDVEVEEIAWVRALVAQDRRRWRELSEAEAMAAQETRDRGLRELGRPRDLKAWELAAAQGEHAGDSQRVGLAHGPATACPGRRRLGGSGEHWGRELRSWRPAAPSFRKRASHL